MLLQLRLDGPIIPKARPRDKTFHLPRDYRKWKIAAIRELRKQYKGPTLPKGSTLRMLFVGKHFRGGDLSNAFGAVEDAIVQAKILRSDNMAHVDEIAAKLHHTKEPPYVLIEIETEEVTVGEAKRRKAQDPTWGNREAQAAAALKVIRTRVFDAIRSNPDFLDRVRRAVEDGDQALIVNQGGDGVLLPRFPDPSGSQSDWPGKIPLIILGDQWNGFDAGLITLEDLKTLEVQDAGAIVDA